ncbi:MAG: hypothetical protein ACYCSJ_03230 [Acidimicrobiales bacterium]
MSDQLTLIDPSPELTWRLDEPTREAGRRGIEAARLALQEASRRRIQRLESDRRAA